MCLKYVTPASKVPKEIRNKRVAYKVFTRDFMTNELVPIFQSTVIAISEKKWNINTKQVEIKCKRYKAKTQTYLSGFHCFLNIESTKNFIAWEILDKYEIWEVEIDDITNYGVQATHMNTKCSELNTVVCNKFRLVKMICRESQKK